MNKSRLWKWIIVSSMLFVFLTVDAAMAQRGRGGGRGGGISRSRSTSPGGRSRGTTRRGGASNQSIRHSGGGRGARVGTPGGGRGTSGGRVGTARGGRAGRGGARARRGGSRAGAGRSARKERRKYAERRWRRQMFFRLTSTAFRRLSAPRTTVVVSGHSYYRVGGVYYDRVIYQGTVTYVVVSAPVGAQVVRVSNPTVAVVSGKTYYVSGHTYYVRVKQESSVVYVVAEPPLTAEVTALPEGVIMIEAGGITYYQYGQVFYEVVGSPTQPKYVIVAPVEVFKANKLAPVRREPFADAVVVFKVQPGTTVGVVGKEGEYLKIRSKHGREPGYVHWQFLDTVPF